MKLRIRGNSIRLRLSQIEVGSLEAEGKVSDRIVFGSGAELAYTLAVDASADATRANFENRSITVTLPAAVMRTWLAPTEVSIHGDQDLGDDAVLKILVEKDFACLEPREGEDQENLFPNPGGKAC